MNFAALPPADRWTTLDRELPSMIRAHVKAADVDPAEQVAIEALADEHGIGALSMANRLRELGGSPYKLGTKWFIRRCSLVIALEAAERESSQKPAPSTKERGGDGR